MWTEKTLFKPVVKCLEENLFEDLRDRELLEVALVDAWFDDNNGRTAPHFVALVGLAYDHDSIDWSTSRFIDNFASDDIKSGRYRNKHQLTEIEAITVLLLDDVYTNFQIPEDHRTGKIRFYHSNFRQVLQTFITDRIDHPESFTGKSFGVGVRELAKESTVLNDLGPDLLHYIIKQCVDPQAMCKALDNAIAEYLQ